MRQFVPSDYIYKNGNVYETVGENIRDGKNGAVASDFPTPEELVDGLESSAYVLRNNDGILTYEKPLGVITKETRYTTPPSTKGLLDYIDSKLPYLKNAKTGIVKIAVDSNKAPTIPAIAGSSLEICLTLEN